MKLPSPDRAIVEERKVRDYPLSRMHPVGRFKARFFQALGFDDRQGDAFVQQVREIAAIGDVSEVVDTGFGRQYLVPGELAGPSGKRPEVVTVWIQETGRDEVRLVTVYPR